MSESTPSPTRAEFARWVQDALNRLYDSPSLRAHPLAEALAGSVAPPQRGQQLRRLLLDAIHAITPDAKSPAQSADWRAHRILELRYIEGLSPAEVMQQLAFGRSYYFREQARMLEALTSTLWDQWQQTLSQAAPPAAAGATREQLAQAETDRLFAHATWETVDPIELLEQLRTPIESLAQAQGVAIRFNLPQRLTVLRADRVLLRQAMLNVIVYALDSARGGPVEVNSFVEGPTTGIRVRTALAAAASQPAAQQRQGVGLDVCRRLMVAMGGALEVQSGSGDRWEARLVWPTSTPHTLLVIDDNQDFADLFRRYLAGHNWQVIGAADGVMARQMLAELVPTVIILDVMMPREDGWELLAKLRANEQTRTTPIIICSVLNEPRLAQTLGATAYLPKPVTQPALLDALAPWRQAGASPAPAR